MGKFATSSALLGCCFLFAFIFLSYPHETFAAEKSGPLILEHADQLISSGGEGEIINLVGNVHFTHDKADLYSKRATWYRKSGLVQFNDSVKVIDANRTIYAQTVTYYRRDRRVSAVNDVYLIDKNQNVTLYCQRADYFRNTKKLEAGGLPRLTFNPDDDSSRMEITSLRMEYYADSSYGVAYDSVRIVRHDMTARAGQAEFYKSPEKAVLTQNPLIINKDNELSGDRIFLYTQDRKIDRLFVDGDAKALYQAMPDTLIGQYTTAELTGREIEAFFADDKIERMVTRVNATSNYSPAPTDTLVNGQNFASGDSITLYFRHGLVKRVLISGGAQGKYIEPKIKADGTPYADTTHYSAKEIDYRFEDSEIKLTDNGSLSFQDMNLTAGDIRYNTETKILIAEGLAGQDTAGEVQLPILRQGNEELDGRRMSYNLETRKGQVRLARTKYEGGYYSGEALRQASEDVLLVSQGDYTSCDIEDSPHFHFHSDRMKMVNKDKVVARPVILYIGRLPVFAVPYYVFPIRKGRHSGFLPFDIGNFERGERFIRNVGYYWALSDYYDLETSLDFYEGSKVRNEDFKAIFNGGLRYALRYRLSGFVKLNYSRQSGWNRTNYTRHTRNRWMLSFSHNQTISPSVSLLGSGSFVSDKSFIPDNVYDVADRLERTVRANGSLSKSWKSTSLVVAADQSWNLDTDEKSERLPSINFSRSELPLFGDPTKRKVMERLRPDQQPEEVKKRFYHSLYFSISGNATNFRQRYKTNDTTFYRKDYQTASTSAGLRSPQNLLGLLTITPSISLGYAAARLERSDITDSLGLESGKVVTRETYRLGATAQTSVYGTIYPSIGNLIGIRHVMTPSVSYAFTPEIKKDQNYFNYVGLGSGSRRSKTATYSLSNLFQAKFKSGDLEKKLDLFTLGFTGTYNFAADSLKLGNLNTSLRTSAVPNLDINFSASHSYYELNSAKRRPLNHLRPLTMSISTSTSWGYHPSGSSGKENGGDKDRIVRKPVFGSTRGAVSSDLGFDLILSHNYSESRTTGKLTKTHWFNLGAQIQPTANWHVGYEARYNIVGKRIESQIVNIERDLHCWQATFSWIPEGPLAGYYFRIYIKSLPDIKIEESEGGMRGGRYY